ncbi:hypothetical protein HO173_009723 [Letharia columbiana]|uniref:Uncharacterized protein n=1 Tax=Letharia columbiana TaxID=112416 RepID=A0A8H6L1L1_9LECA|nr:uncharacterized protein HO173_009723 [Letharia columbiana]KAF6232129.1 hypothetical protein HO173_009723 [Letharia columbiana]
MTSIICQMLSDRKSFAQSRTTAALRCFPFPTGCSGGAAYSVSAIICITKFKSLFSSTERGGSGIGIVTDSSHLVNKRAHSKEQRACCVDQKNIWVWATKLMPNLMGMLSAWAQCKAALVILLPRPTGELLFIDIAICDGSQLRSDRMGPVSTLIRM